MDSTKSEKAPRNGDVVTVTRQLIPDNPPQAALAKEQMRAEMAAGIEARLAHDNAHGKKRKRDGATGSDKRGRTS